MPKRVRDHLLTLAALRLLQSDESAAGIREALQEHLDALWDAMHADEAGLVHDHVHLMEKDLPRFMSLALLAAQTAQSVRKKKGPQVRVAA